MENVKKNKLREIYESLPARQISMKAPKSEFIIKMADLTKSHPTTVRAWIYGTQRPDALKTSLISQELGVPADELFN